jgi:hypothetical protein
MSYVKYTGSAVIILVGWWLIGQLTWGANGAVNVRYVRAARTACPDQPPDTFIAFRRRGDGYEFRCPTSTHLLMPSASTNGNGSYPFVRTVPAPDGWSPDQVGLSSSPKGSS